MPNAIAVQIAVDDRQAREAIQRLIRKASSLRPAFAEIGEYVMTSTLHHFDTESAPDGTHWKPLADATVQQKAKGGWSSNILIRTGRMRASIHPVVKAWSVEVGTNIKGKSGFGYPGIHQTGGTRIPKREWLGTSETDVDVIGKILERHLRST
jgi:phage virion morphogenesis protein